MEELITVDPVSGLKILPHWLSQPYIRAQPKLAAKAEQNAAKAEEVVAQGGEACCPPGKTAHKRISVSTFLNTSIAEPAEVDELAPEGLAVGKRATSERTPEPDDAAKRVKLDTVDPTEPPTATIA